MHPELAKSLIRHHLRIAISCIAGEGPLDATKNIGIAIGLMANVAGSNRIYGRRIETLNKLTYEQYRAILKDARRWDKARNAIERIQQS